MADRLVLRTKRLLLYALTPAQAAALLDGADPAGFDPARWHPGKGWPHADTFDALRPFAEHGADDLPGPWLVVDRETAAILGEVGWHSGPDADGTVEVGYGLSPAFHRRGYGSEAVRAWCEWADARPDVARFTAAVLPGNIASIRLLERLGFAFAGSAGDGHVRYVRNGSPVRNLPNPGPRT